ncbi:ERV25 [Sanghuangporus sanghuang]
MLAGPMARHAGQHGFRCILRSMFSPTSVPFLLLTLFTLFAQPVQAIKFQLSAYKTPPAKCIWNAVHPNQLVIVTANVGKGDRQRVDIEIVDSSPQKNQYLSKRNINGETRLAVTSHAEGEVGVCFRNYLDKDLPSEDTPTRSRIIDLDIDIGADAVDYNAIAAQESLSGLETEMRKLEEIVKEIVDEMDYLKKREQRFSSTNESTNKRVQNFGFYTFLTLIGLGVWQIFHLRSYFKRKYLID